MYCYNNNIAINDIAQYIILYYTNKYIKIRLMYSRCHIGIYLIQRYLAVSEHSALCSFCLLSQKITQNSYANRKEAFTTK